MRRDKLNMFLDGLLSLSPEEPESSRKLLIELANVSDSYADLVAEWLYFHDFWKERILELKTWLGLNYFQLQQLFDCSHRDVARLLRARRTELLPPYPPRGSTDEEPQAEALPGGLSCFMVEQHLSPWIDAEWESYSELSKIKEHLSVCSSCQSRLTDYRALHQRILGQRRQFEPISQAEWDQTLKNLRKRSARRFRNFVLGLIVVLGCLAAIIAVMRTQPERMPNIYEIESEISN